MKCLRSILPCAATLAALAGGTVLADTRPTLQSLQDQLNSTYTRQQVDNLSRNPDPACFDNNNRYVDCGNGTVTDTVTGLVWLKQATCLGSADYTTANTLAAALQAGQCGLTDHSKPGDWRLPTNEEWWDTLFLDVLDCRSPALTNTAGNGCFSDGPQPFSSVLVDIYWSSSAQVDTPDTAWSADLHYGEVASYQWTGLPSRIAVAKSQTHLAWPVRARLTAGAFPPPEGYIIRAQVYEGLTLGDWGKTAVTDYWQKNGFGPVDGTQVFWTTPPAGQYVSQILIVNGRVDIVYGVYANPAIAGKVLSLTPYDDGIGRINWRCGNAPAPSGQLLGTGSGGPVAAYQASTVDNQYLPTNCRP